VGNFEATHEGCQGHLGTVQTLAADLGIPGEVAKALDPTIPTITPPLETSLEYEFTSRRASEQMQTETSR